MFLEKSFFRQKDLTCGINSFRGLLCLQPQKASNSFTVSFSGGFYQDSVAAVGVTPEGHGCQHCPNGTFIHPNKAPGKASWECKACPEGQHYTVTIPDNNTKTP